MGLLFLCVGKSLADLVWIITVDNGHVPSPGTILGLCVFIHHFLALCRELDVVGVIEHDEVVQSEDASQTTCALGNFFLYTSV